MKIKAKDLRIGNWLRYSDNKKLKPELRGTDFQVIADDILAIEEGHTVVELIKPIPLTEEWLTTLGFKRFGKDTFYLGSVKIHHRKRGFVIAKRYTDLIYVHQLQNLYYALTNKELEI